MRVTSLIGGSTRREGPSEPPPPEHLAWLEGSRKARHVEPGRRQVGVATGERRSVYQPPGRKSSTFWHPEPSRGQLTSDVGLLPARRFNPAAVRFTLGPLHRSYASIPF